LLNGIAEFDPRLYEILFFKIAHAALVITVRPFVTRAAGSKLKCSERETAAQQKSSDGSVF
jgi:hypothetical protein